MTRSPFPGMDPWLEFSWRDVHARLIIYIANQIQRQLPESLVARAEETVSIDALGPERPASVRPDVAVTEDKPYELNEGAVAAALPPPPTVAKALRVRVPVPELDRRV